MSLQLEVRSFSLALRQPLRTAQRIFTTREGGVIRLADENGCVGFGEVCPLPGFSRDRWEDSLAALKALGEQSSWEELARLPSHLECLHGAVIAARRMMEQQASQQEGEGKTKGASSPPPAAWPMAALLPAGRAVLAEIDRRLELGFRVFKWKVGVGSLGDEVALLDDLLGRMPSGARLRLDANGAWDRRQAERWLERCAERPIEHVEQPIDPGHRGADDLLLGLANDYPTPLALDESLVGDGDISAWREKGWPGVFVVKLSLLAKPQQVLANLARAQAKVVFSSALETAVGARNALELAFSWPGERRALGFGVWPLFQEMFFNGPHAAPFLHWGDVQALDPKTVWTALA